MLVTKSSNLASTLAIWLGPQKLAISKGRHRDIASDRELTARRISFYTVVNTFIYGCASVLALLYACHIASNATNINLRAYNEASSQITGN